MKHAPADVIAINRRVLFVLWLLLQGLQLMTTVSQPVYDTKNDTVSQSSICLQKTVQFLDFCCCFSRSLALFQLFHHMFSSF